MWKNVVVPVLVFALLLASRRAGAFYDSPYVTPEYLVAGETVFVNIRGGECDALFTEPISPQITQVGGAIRILFWSVHDEYWLFCNHGIGTLSYPIGAYSPGLYSIQVDRYDHLSYGQPAAVTLGVVPFVVHGAAASVPAPALGHFGLAILGLLVSSSAFLALRSRRQEFLVVLLCLIPPAARPRTHPAIM